MKYILIIIAFPVLIGEQCSKRKDKSKAPVNQVETTGSEQSKDSIPPCVTQKIEAIKKESKWNPTAQVDEYIYNDKHVYLFSSNCCDQFNILYDDSCNSICAPSGGITGHGDQKCNDFFKAARYVKLVWKDPR